jgi:hypothetical protein
MKLMRRVRVPVTPAEHYAWTYWRAVWQLNYKLLQHSVHRNIVSLYPLFKLPTQISFTFIINGQEGLNKTLHPLRRVA